VRRESNGLTETNRLRPVHPIAESPRSRTNYTLVPWVACRHILFLGRLLARCILL
jgi:hypothetical protein